MPCCCPGGGLGAAGIDGCTFFAKAHHFSGKPNDNQQYVCRFGRTKCRITIKNKMLFIMPPGTLKSFQLFLRPLPSNHHLRRLPTGAFISIFSFFIVKHEICVYCLTIEITKWFSSRQFDLYNYSSSAIDRI